MTNVGIVMWMPVSIMILAMILWFVALVIQKKVTKAKSIEWKQLLQGWLVCTAVAFVFMVFKTLVTPVLRPINEVSPRVVRPADVDVVVPTDLKNLTLKAKPKDVINSQPKTPLVDKAVKDVQDK